MFGRIIFYIAAALFTVSLFVPSISVVGEETKLTGLQTFIYTLHHATANLFAPNSAADFVVNFVALVAAGANFVFVFWALLVLTPTRITSLKWFWWVSTIFLLAAVYTGVQAVFSEKVALEGGYYFWLSALILMLVAPVVSRVERIRVKRFVRRTENLGNSNAV